MSMHKLPITEFELLGLKNHGLASETPSQLSDVFRQGMAWAICQNKPLNKMKIPPSPADAIYVAYTEGWNACCEKMSVPQKNSLKLDNQTMRNQFNQVIDYAISQGYEAEDFLAAWSVLLPGVWVTQASGQTLPLSK